MAEKFISGFQFYEGTDEIAFSILKRAELILKHEPDNLYDEKALANYARFGNKLGYILRLPNEVPSNLWEISLKP